MASLDKDMEVLCEFVTSLLVVLTCSVCTLDALVLSAEGGASLCSEIAGAGASLAVAVEDTEISLCSN